MVPFSRLKIPATTSLIRSPSPEIRKSADKLIQGASARLRFCVDYQLPTVYIPTYKEATLLIKNATKLGIISKGNRNLTFKYRISMKTL